MKLVIDTAEETRVSLWDQGQVLFSENKVRSPRSQVLLHIIDKTRAITEDWRLINEIEVNTGPGSFTGLRVGAAVANAMAYALKIKVNDKKSETDLIYS